jgi:cysteine desulfurase
MLGIEAERELESARRSVARLIAASPVEIYFTSGGTEANNIAILGGVKAQRRKGTRIVTTTVEHPSVREAINGLQDAGFEILKLTPDRDGEISDDALYSAINRDTVLVSMMAVNNETGMKLPIGKLKEAIKRSGSPALLHVDGVQAVGKLSIFPERLGVDLLSMSSHKLHGPKGAGALYIKKGVRISPVVFGGGQERGIRSGTEPLPAICGFGAAAGELQALEELEIHFEQLKKTLLKELADVKELHLNSTEKCFPGIVSVAIPGYKSEVLLHSLAKSGVYVSSGSACAKGKPSATLQAIGVPFKDAEGTLRFSFSRYNTVSEVEKAAQVLKGVLLKVKKGSN